jgi:Flp pilus assembly protein TadG
MPTPSASEQRALIARRGRRGRRPRAITPLCARDLSAALPQGGASWRAPCHRHTRSHGVSAVEFALIGPTAFLLLIGAVVLAIVVTHEIQLSQAVRDGARAAAICGSSTDQSTGSTLPDGTPCTTADLVHYINVRVDAVSPTLANQAVVTVFSPSGTNLGGPASLCQSGYTAQVSISYQQPLYLPLVGVIFGSAGTNTRTISAQGEATCEQ